MSEFNFKQWVVRVAGVEEDIIVEYDEEVYLSTDNDGDYVFRTLDQINESIDDYDCDCGCDCLRGIGRCGYVYVDSLSAKTGNYYIPKSTFVSIRPYRDSDADLEIH